MLCLQIDKNGEKYPIKMGMKIAKDERKCLLRFLTINPEYG